MPSPREVALRKNAPALFGDPDEDQALFNEIEGIPRLGAGCGGHRRDPDYRSQATPAPDAPAPCKNLKRDK